MIVAELERANNRAASAERRNVRVGSLVMDLYSRRLIYSANLQELLRAEIEAVRSGSDASRRYDDLCIARPLDLWNLL